MAEPGVSKSTTFNRETWVPIQPGEMRGRRTKEEVEDFVKYRLNLLLRGRCVPVARGANMNGVCVYSRFHPRGYPSSDLLWTVASRRLDDPCSTPCPAEGGVCVVEQVVGAKDRRNRILHVECQDPGSYHRYFIYN
ncbi:hypothetical protein O9K51_08158 [Purpureocillium lavendulum]|uniref:Uncharacterized protein n=1 Tax=Purpureocillium lavendulum TaxID=1247861 RepID=A0AB34FI27_9HYPO|nr:hypothetical protein O9K51_08158 [Purpureocillium lavendulum]